MSGCRTTCPYSDVELSRLHVQVGGCNPLARFLKVPPGTLHGWLVRAGIKRFARGGPNNPKGNGGWKGKQRRAG